MSAGDVDYYGLDELLGEDERLTRASVRSFVEREALPLIEACHRREEFPRELIPRLAELGVFGANLQGYGCAGLSNVAYGLIMQELEGDLRGDVRHAHPHRRTGHHGPRRDPLG